MSTKRCKYCGSVIPSDANYCFFCRNKQGSSVAVIILSIALGIMFMLNILLLAVIGSTPQTTSTATTSPSNTPPVTSTVPAPSPTPSVKERVRTLTMEKYSMLEIGMSYAEVVEILGVEGNLTDEVCVAGIDFQQYEWKEGSVFILMQFNDGQLTTRYELGLN